MLKNSLLEVAIISLFVVFGIPSSTQEERKPKCGESDIVMSNPHNCSTYYVCDGDKATLRPCPDGLYFNSHIYVCDYPVNVDCEYQTPISDGSPPCPPNTGPLDKPIFMPNPLNCSTFYVCEVNAPFATLRPCSPDLYWNQELETCVFPWDSECVQPTLCPGGPAATYEACDDDCTRYFFCAPEGDNEVPSYLKCPDGTYFEEDSNSCAKYIPERCAQATK